MATTLDCVELKYEETPRYEGAASTTPYAVSTVARHFPAQSFALRPAPAFDDRSDEIRGFEGGPFQLIDTYAPEGSLAERAYVNDLIFLLGLAGFKGTYTAGGAGVMDPDGGSIPTGAARWVFLKRGGRQAKTAQLQAVYVDEGVAMRGQGFGVSGLSMTSAGAVTADLMGMVYANIADPNISPVFDSVAIPHLRRGDLSVTWMAGSGKTDDFSFSIANPLVRVRSMGVASYFPDDLEHDNPRVRVTGTIPKRALADADIDALLAGTTFVGKAFWQSPKVIGATAYKYSMWLEMPAVQLLAGGADPLTNARRFGGSFDWWASWDETAGYDAKLTLVGSVTSVSSVGN